MIIIDVIKVACRQTKDSNYAVTFTLHPNDKSNELKDAEIGSQWRMHLEPLDLDGNPSDAGDPKPPVREAGPREDKPLANPASRLTQMACICCNDPVFWRYLSERGWTVTDRNQARNAIYEECDVKSRKEFIMHSAAGDRWIRFYDGFALWRDMPEAVEQS